MDSLDEGQTDREKEGQTNVEENRWKKGEIDKKLQGPYSQHFIFFVAY